MILLYCEHEKGQASLEETHIDGLEVAARTYDIVDHYVEVTGMGSDGVANDAVAMHDANRLCEMSPIYRLANAHEQNLYTKTQATQGSVEEAQAAQEDKQDSAVLAPVNEEYTPDASDVSDVSTSDTSNAPKGRSKRKGW